MNGRLIAFLLVFFAAVQAAHALTTAEQQLLEKARFWQQRGNLALAEKPLKKILLTNPNQPDALTMLGVIAAQAGRQEDARKYMERLRATHPGHPGIQQIEAAIRLGKRVDHLARARAYAEKGAVDEAIEEYKKYFAGNEPQGDVGLEYYLVAARKTRNWEMVRQGLSRLVRSAPDNEKYRLALGRHLTYRERTRLQGIRMLEDLAGSPEVGQEARTAWRQALLWLPADGSSIPLLQRYLARVGKDVEIEAALAKAKQAVNRPPDPFALKLKQGFEAYEKGKLSSAETYFTDALRLKSDSADAYGGLGLVRLKQRRFAEANQYLTQAMRLDPRHASRWRKAQLSAAYWAYIRRADAQIQKDPKAAVQALRKAVRLRPNAIEARLMLADALLQQGKGAEAAREYKKVLEHAPDHYDALMGLARAYLLQGHNDEAANVALRMTKLKPEREEGIQLLIRAYGGVEDLARNPERIDRAIDGLEQLLVEDPSNPWARLNLARLYRLQGNTAKAESLLDGLIRTNPEMVEARYARALLAVDMKRWQEARDFLASIPVQSRTKEMQALADRIEIKSKIAEANSLAEVGRKRQARKILAEIEEKAMASPEDAGSLINAWARAGDLPHAMRLARRAIKSKPKGDIDAKLTYASLLMQAGEDSELEITLRHLESLRSSMSDKQKQALDELLKGAAIRQADQAREAGRFAEAWEYLAPHLEQEPPPTDVLMALARIFHDAGRDQEALSIYEEVLRREPTNADALEAAAFSAIAAKDYDRAEELIDQGMSHYPNSPRFYNLAGKLERARGNDEVAARVFQRAEELKGGVEQPSNAPVWDVRRRNPFLPQEAAQPPVTPQKSAWSARIRSPRTAPPLEHRTVTAAEQQRIWEPRRRRAVRASAMKERQQLSEAELIIAEHATRLSGGVYVRGRNGEAGTSSLTDIEVPTEVRIRPGQGYFYVKAVPVILNAGSLDFANTNIARRFGSSAVNLVLPQNIQKRQSDAGIALTLGYQSDFFSVDLGTSPLGFTVVNLVGGLSFNIKANDMVFGLDASRRSVTDSLLAYAGTLDPGSGVKWGGVTSNGVVARWSFVNADYGLYSKVGYHRLIGKQVLGNDSYEVTAGGFWRIRDEVDRRMRVGVNLTLLGYSKNLSYYTLGHGGYFSPQQYVTVNVPVSMEGRKGQLSYLLSGALGVQTFREDGALYYPKDPALQAALVARGLPSVYPVRNVTGINFSLRGVGEYRATPTLTFGGSFAFDNARNYTQFGFGMYVRYWFAPQPMQPNLPPQPLLPYFETQY